MDHVTPQVRSQIMRKVKGKNTKPEMAVRRLLHGLGYRYRLHRKDLPGKPDIVFPSLKKVVLVHGCFWHRHPDCRWTTTPKTRKKFWKSKFDANVKRDRKAVYELRRKGWDVLIVWQCQTNEVEALYESLTEFLSD